MDNTLKSHANFRSLCLLGTILLISGIIGSSGSLAIGLIFFFIGLAGLMRERSKPKESSSA
ncbi:hypothetical protein ACFLU6_10340 [Acidobacteriota bacterium]